MAQPANEQTIYTIGHSNHALPRFLELLRQHGIGVVVDTRSYPSSKYSPQFNAQPLKRALEAEGIKYSFLGEELGGRPRDERMYDAEGHVLYSEVAKSALFLDAVETLKRGIKHHRVAMLCSEENPCVCHRKLLVGRVLNDHGISVVHIRGDGRLETDRDLDAESPQASLFEEMEEREWKSLLSVLPRKTHPNSSAF